MTTCGDICAKLSALLDNELPEDESAVVRQHLDSCDDCRQEWQELQSLDQQLNGLLTIDGVPEKVASISQASPLQLASTETNRRSVVTWASIIAAIATVILVAFFMTRPRTDQETVVEKPNMIAKKEDPPKPQIVAHLVRATGPVKILPSGSEQWISADPVAEFSITEGARLKTGDDVLCEFTTTTAGKFRVNESAEIVVHNSDQVELLKGKLWCLAPKDSAIDVRIPVQDGPLPKIATMTCPRDAEIQCVAGESFAACDSVSKQNPPAQLAIGTFTCPIGPGETVSIDAQQNVDRKVDPSATKVWQLPLLATGHSIDDELLLSISGLLAPVGMTKARHLNETQIRRLGPNGALPLLAFVESETAPSQLQLRRTAVRIASDLADEKAIEILQKLASDPDPYISRCADQALKKIAQQAN